MGLKAIQKIIASPDFDELKALKTYFIKLSKQKEQLEILINNVRKTIISIERDTIMNDREKFAGFKKKIIEENEAIYGQEIRELYEEEIIGQSNERVKNMTKIEQELMETLKKAMQTGNPAGEWAQKAAGLHRQWLSFYWGSYNKEAHASLVRMYVTDERFSYYYDKNQPGTAQFLRDAVLFYTGISEQ